MSGHVKVAVVGAGPAGTYVAGELLSRSPVPCTVDVLDRDLTPWGLVRSGVAPDHPKIKSVTRVFDRIADREGYAFWGGVNVGSDVTHEELTRHFDVVVYATGAEVDRRLGIPGEDLAGVMGAGAFVGWYNGRVAEAGLEIGLDGRRAVVVGNGNVAMDCARMLLAPDELLTATDMADHAIHALSASAVDEVVLLGRRGPDQAACSPQELRELCSLPGLTVVVEGAELDGDSEISAILRDAVSREPDPSADKRLVLRFHASPTEVIGADAVTGVRIGGEVVECSLLITAIGFSTLALPDVPFAEDLGRIPHEDGRVAPGVYVAGWAKRGPRGVIGENKRCATATAASIMADIESGAIARGSVRPSFAALLNQRVPAAVTIDGWRRIDRAEVSAGLAQQRPRVKFVSVADLQAAVRATDESEREAS
ncbi:FAD-dependent oxidoreductase [Aeromicrobium sp. P5_D10]